MARYRWWGVAAAAALALTATAQAGNGDINGDRSVTTADTALALRAAGGLAQPTEAQAFAGDVQPAALDGRVTLADAVAIARMAAGVAPAPPGLPLETTVSLTVSGNATRNIPLPGGYAVSGRVRDTQQRAIAGSVAFQNTATGALFGPFPLDDTGDYAAVLPPGTYQAVVLTQVDATTGLGEAVFTDRAVAAGSPFTVNATQTARNITRPNLAATYRVDLKPSVAGSTVFFLERVLLLDTGTTSGTYGLNRVERENAVFPPPGAIGVDVPAGTYFVEARGSISLSGGTAQSTAVLYGDDLPVSRATTRAFTIPAVYELTGQVVLPSSASALDILSEGRNTTTGDVFSAEAGVNNLGGFALGLPPGAHILRAGITAPFDDAGVDFLAPFTMPSRSASKTITPPALPAFRVVSGKVVAPTGAPVANAVVRAFQTLDSVPAAGAYEFRGEALTDANGAYTLHLPNGAYTVRVTPP